MNAIKNCCWIEIDLPISRTALYLTLLGLLPATYLLARAAVVLAS